jgi:EAL domain-containing protein (putative c-di-GMP-specific phosphodiesterase class I)
MNYNKDDSLIVETIIAIGQKFNLKIIAEGVEDERQLNYLKELGCDEFQGYLFSKPVFAEEMTKLLKVNQEAI